MPIIEHVVPNALLAQGDLLAGMPLFVTGHDGQASRTAHRLCLVMSRPCVAQRKGIVAAVEKYPDDVPKDLDSFDKVLKFLIAVQDGALTPDLFYLGQVPNEKVRFCARFDSIHTVEIPTGEIERSEFVQTHQATSCRQGGLPEAMRVFVAINAPTEGGQWGFFPRKYPR